MTTTFRWALLVLPCTVFACGEPATDDDGLGPVCVDAKCDDAEASDHCVEFMRCVVGQEGDVTECADLHRLPGGTPCESAQALAARHAAVAARRSDDAFFLLAHRGSWAFGRENGLEALHSTGTMGGDGNEIDVRITADGIGVLLHDDFVQRDLPAIGGANAYTFDELMSLPMRSRYGHYECDSWIPTLVEAVNLHREDATLMGIDVKDPAVVDHMIDVIDALDVWDQVWWTSSDDVRAKRTITGLAAPQVVNGYESRSDMDMGELDTLAASSGAELWVEHPAAAVVATGGQLGDPSSCRDSAIADLYPAERRIPDLVDGSAAELCAALDRVGTQEVSTDPAVDEDMWQSHTLPRFQLARTIAARPELDTPECRQWLRELALSGGLHADWTHHRVDAAEAVMSLAALDDPQLGAVIRELATRVDPRLDAIAKLPPYDTFIAPGDPTGSIDWLIKSLIWDAARQTATKHADLAALGFELLALDEAQRRELAVTDPQELVETILDIDPDVATFSALLDDPRRSIWGRARWVLLNRVRQVDDADLAALLADRAPWLSPLANR